ncbi:type IX secretion system plug protein domain-containing protein [Fodinibius salsisoli]|uniref:DUF5103 domain-containing protein n=1 Tax=Fodinibius salsisoli TaxID=2820877 RepID=A0ABT3PL61_9BACT|nr:type IX secretion system plug protein domain-containing protein [Fodinibius salsisoli]MCW9706661.1 DUF5103 domain-containing protein [Fodinibius salsisoli]
MSLKVRILDNIFWLSMLLVCLASCSSLESTSGSPQGQSSLYSQLPFALAEQKSPPREIQAIQLYPKEQPGKPPIITLGSNNQLTLSFDYLSQQSRQFRIEISHRSRDWKESSIPISTYMDSFFQTYIQKSQQSTANDPTYQHVEYHFPNDNLRPIVSGNYLIEVYSYRDDQLLFSMPFFISENKGALQTRAETLFAQRSDGRSINQLFSTYRYPSMVEFPQFDLSVSYVQNQFWGRMRAADFLNTSTPGQLTAELNRDNTFVSDYPFQLLNLESFTLDGRQVLEFQPETIPPTVTLRRDVQGLSTKPPLLPGEDIGFALHNRSSRYAMVHFSLETSREIAPTDDIYIIGDFNNWMLSDFNKMQFNPDNRLWEGKALIKQGKYGYIYVLEQESSIKILNLDPNFFTRQQEYLTFVYFKDPDQNFDRLLKVHRALKP